MAPLLSRLGAGRGGFGFGFGKKETSPIYSIISSASSRNEGSSVTFTVNTINVESGTTLYWTINSVSGTVNASDFNEGVSGSFVISGSTGSVILNISNDVTTEGSESFQLQVRTGSTSGTVVATSATVTINDTSLTPTSLSATGGTVAIPGNGYKYHTFTSPGSFVVSSVGSLGGTVEVIAVAGGGGGGNYQSGGGGAGGLAYNPSFSVTTTSYPILIGEGGVSNTSGSNTTAFGITALGGGNGGARAPGNVPARSGGSGGGAGSQHPGIGGGAPGTQPSQPQPSGTLNYGNPGGGNAFPAGGGGGGAGGGGGNAGPPTLSGKGGDGRQYPQFTGSLIGVPALIPLNGYFAGGGSGAGEYGTDQAVQPGGAGGGGGGSAGTPGVTNSGGGGAGGRGGGGGTGGSGIVVIRYPF